jgi:hypothetical protein
VPAIAAVLGQGVEHAVEHPGADSGLMAPMAGLVTGDSAGADPARARRS